jgi:predicted nucleic acid-binding protein
VSVRGKTVVFVDSNVWFSRTLRDWLGLLYTIAETPPFEVRWTEDVLAEVIHHLRDKHPDWDGARIAGIRDRVVGMFETGRVTDFVIDGSYEGRDSHDAHIHAAAVACGADVLLTCNVADFVWDENTSPYEVFHPDDFLILVDDVAPGLVAKAVVANCSYWFNKDGEADLPAHLKLAGCPGFAERVRKHLQGSAGRRLASESKAPRGQRSGPVSGSWGGE